jgi:hypothetical protein
LYFNTGGKNTWIKKTDEIFIESIAAAGRYCIDRFAGSFCISGYKATVSFLVSTIHEEARAAKIFSLVTANKFLLLQLILFFILGIIIFLLVKFNAIWEITLRFLHQFKKSFVQIFGNALRSDTLFIFILPVQPISFLLFISRYL